jgi:hypothetical protein
VFNYVIFDIHGKQADASMYKIADPNAANFTVEVKDHFTESAH